MGSACASCGSENNSPDCSLTKDERCARFVKVVMIVRSEFRNSLGMPTPRSLSDTLRRIHWFADWIDYPKGDRLLTPMHKGIVHCAVVSCDGRWLFTGSDDRSIIAWDLIESSHTQQSIAHDDSVLCLAYHPSGMLVSGSADSSIRTWKACSMQSMIRMEGHLDAVSTVDVNRGGNRVVSGSADGSLRVWDSHSGQCLIEMSGHIDWINTVLFVSDNMIVSGSEDKSLKWWDLNTGDESRRMTFEWRDSVECLCISKDHTRIAVCLFGKVTVFSWPMLCEILSIECANNGGQPGSCVFHPLHSDLLVIAESNDIRVYHLRMNTCQVCFQGHSEPVQSVVFSPYGQRLVSVSSDQTVRLWDTSHLS